MIKCSVKEKENAANLNGNTLKENQNLVTHVHKYFKRLIWFVKFFN